MFNFKSKMDAHHVFYWESFTLLLSDQKFKSGGVHPFTLVSWKRFRCNWLQKECNDYHWKNVMIAPSLLADNVHVFYLDKTHILDNFSGQISSTQSSFYLLPNQIKCSVFVLEYEKLECFRTSSNYWSVLVTNWFLLYSSLDCQKNISIITKNYSEDQ